MTADQILSSLADLLAPMIADRLGLVIRETPPTATPDPQPAHPAADEYRPLKLRVVEWLEAHPTGDRFECAAALGIEPAQASRELSRARIAKSGKGIGPSRGARRDRVEQVLRYLDERGTHYATLARIIDAPAHSLNSALSDDARGLYPRVVALGGGVYAIKARG